MERKRPCSGFCSAEPIDFMNHADLIQQDTATSDPHAADALLRSLYDRASLDTTGLPGQFRYRQKVDGDSRMTIVRMRSTDRLNIRNEINVFAVAQTMAGNFRYGATGGEHSPAARPTLVPRHVGIQGRGEDFDLLVVNLDPTAIASFADVRPEVGSLLRTPLQVTEARSRESERLWVASVRHVASEVLPNAEVMRSELVRTSAFRLLCVAAIEAFGTPSTLPPAEADRVLPDAVRRARAFIDDNGNTAITVDDVARAARLSTRGLQWAFRRHLDTTPTEYLRRVRLEGARRDLLAAEPDGDASVETIALRWGFAHSGRFAGYYQDAFHERPSATLKR